MAKTKYEQSPFLKEAPTEDYKSIVSKQRVADHGEVYTRPEEVNAMLDLVQHETERIDSRFLEPACGTGGFLVEVLGRKLGIVDQRYWRTQLHWERNAVLAVASIYGIDLLEDNVAACRERLLALMQRLYADRFKAKSRPELLDSARVVLERNIIWGDALTLKTAGPNPQPIIFTEWSYAHAGNMIKMRDYRFADLMEQPAVNLPLFSNADREPYIPIPVRDYPLVHYLEISHVDFD